MAGTSTTTIDVATPLIVVRTVDVPLVLPDVTVVVRGPITEISTTTILVGVPLMMVGTVLVRPVVSGPIVVV